MAKPIEIENLVVSYSTPRGQVEALRGVSLSVDEGTVVGFLGPNGAGKTTTIHVLLGFVGATSGEARVFGEDVRQTIARRRIGYLPEHPDMYRFLTGREALRMAGRLFGLNRSILRQRIGELLKLVGMEDAADRRIGTYSRGMMQRIGVAQALVNDPDLVILDEPTGGLDPLGRMEIRKIISGIKERGKTVFFSSHELSEVEMICDEVAILAAGRIAARGPVDKLVGDQRLEQYFLETVAKAVAAGGEGA